MRRIRIVFALLAVMLLVPMVLLVQRALASLALERDVSHRAVAERLLDEMERELSSLLRKEEERPIDFYRFGTDAGGKRDTSAVAPAYTVGFFQIDPDGNFRTAGSGPADPAAESSDSPTAAGDFADQEGGGFAAIVRQGLRGENDSKEPAAAERALAPLRDSLLEFEMAKEKKQERLDDAAVDSSAKSKARKQVSPYEALQALNKGALARSERQVKRAETRSAARPRPSAPVPVADEMPVPELGAASDLDGSHAGGRMVAEAFATAVPTADRDAAERQAIDALEIFEEIAPREGAFEVHPMVGRLIDAERLLLVRLVFLGERRYRQGLVVNLPALFERLDSIVVGGSELEPYVGREFFTTARSLPETLEREGHRTLHRFAEPFDSLGVRLTLQPLPDVGGSGYLYAIAALLLVSGTGGLLAVYKMVSVTVRFAERRSNFVAAVSHELKTPLTAIRMYAEMLRDGMVDDEAKRKSYYGTITAESERLTRLIDNVLEFSRLEQGNRETSMVVGSIGPVVRDAAAILEAHARELGFRMEVEVESGLPPVCFDRDAVLQVVVNLVDNALKYARSAGDRSVVIRCVGEAGGVSVAVRDRGPGVPARHLSKIFEPFYRGEDELTRTAKGTGIGLALVRGLAEAMDAVVTGRNLADGGFEVALRFRPAPPG